MFLVREAAGGDPYWNTNVARHAGILRAVPDGCRDALDVGCGDGLLVRKLAGCSQRVTGMDLSPEMVSRARKSSAGLPGVRFLEGDFLTLDDGVRYDFVCSVAAVHHMDFAAALTRMSELLHPGGTLVVVGLARDAGVAERASTLAAAPLVRVTKAVRGARDPQGVPMTDPGMSYREVRAVAGRLLPGVRYRRHVLRRYSLTWHKPAPDHGTP
jgi:SAM-dependent methyltransferase